MSAVSDYLENLWLNYALRATAFTSPTTVYISLHTADPGDTGANEVNTTPEVWYARQSITFAAPSARAVSSNATVTYAQKSNVDALTITHFAIWDASSAGNCLFADALSSSVGVAQNQTPKFNSGNVTITVDTGGMTNGHADDFLNHVLRNTTYTNPGDTFIALFTASPGDAGSATNEVAAGVNYNRQTMTEASDYNAAAGGATANTNVETFSTPSGSWGTVTHFAICEAGTRAVADLMFYAALDSSVAPANGDTVEWAAGALDITLA